MKTPLKRIEGFQWNLDKLTDPLTYRDRLPAMEVWQSDGRI